jgi:hypothetical protein
MRDTNLAYSEISEARTKKAAGHEEPGSKRFGLLLVIRPAIPASPKLAFQVRVDIEGVAEDVMTELVAGRVPLTSSRVTCMEEDAVGSASRHIHTTRRAEVGESEDKP